MNVISKIAIVDDVVVAIKYYEKALQSEGFAVSIFRSPTALLDHLKTGRKYDLYLVDLMMPAVSYPDEETEEGLLTGLFLARDIRTLDADNPIIIFSNINIQRVIRGIKSALKNENNIAFISKADMPPHDLGSTIGSVLDKGLKSFTKRGFISKVFDLVILQPNFYGVGIDFKQLKKNKKGA